jgi:hypothetical protein
MAQSRGRPKNPPRPKEMLKEVLPVADLFDDDELRIYNSLVDIYLKDFEDEDLSSGDMDDILGLAMNRVFEIRLLRTSKGNPDKQLDISNAIEKLRKQDDNLKSNLSTRRRDRINPNEFKGFSIVDLAVAFDEDKKMVLKEKIRRLKQEEEQMLEKRSNYSGNRYDVDTVEKNANINEEE